MESSESPIINGVCSGGELNHPDLMALLLMSGQFLSTCKAGNEDVMEHRGSAPSLGR